MQKTIKKIQSGFTIIELLIVIAIIGILAGLVLTNFQGAQAKARDAQRKTRLNSVYGKLEEYYNNNNGYPDGVLSQAVLPGIDANALLSNDSATTAIVQSYQISPTAPAPSTASTTGNQYKMYAYGCTAAVAQSPVGATCTKYILQTYLEKDPAGLYAKSSLN